MNILYITTTLYYWPDTQIDHDFFFLIQIFESMLANLKMKSISSWFHSANLEQISVVNETSHRHQGNLVVKCSIPPQKLKMYQHFHY